MVSRRLRLLVGQGQAQSRVLDGHGPAATWRPARIRVSGGWGTTEDDWSRFADAWLEACTRASARAGRVKEVA